MMIPNRKPAVYHPTQIIALTIALTALLTFSSVTRSSSQDVPPPNPEIALNIVSGQSILFIFDEIDEYVNGIMNAGHVTYIRVGCITDWKLQFRADQDMFYGLNNPANTMELNNVGVVVVSLGSNQDDGSHIINNAKTLPLALEFTDITLLTKGTLSNFGYAAENSFTLNWEMGTQRGNMNNLSMLEQELAPDRYILNIILTLSFY
jgi:hypothetical protein